MGTFSGESTECARDLRRCQGLKPDSCCGSAARLKPCPDTQRKVLLPARGCGDRRLPALASQRGVTMIEMLVVVAVLAIVVGVSIPSISAGLDSIRLASTGDAIA